MSENDAGTKNMGEAKFIEILTNDYTKMADPKIISTQEELDKYLAVFLDRLADDGNLGLAK